MTIDALAGVHRSCGVDWDWWARSDHDSNAIDYLRLFTVENEFMQVYLVLVEPHIFERSMEVLEVYTNHRSGSLPRKTYAGGGE